MIVGMDRDQVLLAIGKPRHKERNVSDDGTEIEDWIYGDPPGKITFVTFAGSKVTRGQGSLRRYRRVHRAAIGCQVSRSAP